MFAIPTAGDFDVDVHAGDLRTKGSGSDGEVCDDVRFIWQYPDNSDEGVTWVRRTRYAQAEFFAF